MLATESVRMSPTENEINNIIFLFIKFGLQKLMPDAKKPANSLIKEIMLAVSEDPTEEKIFEEILTATQKKYGITISDINVRGLREYMRVLYKNFMALPEHMRNDLGTDTEDDVFHTKH